MMLNPPRKGRERGGVGKQTVRLVFERPEVEIPETGKVIDEGYKRARCDTATRNSRRLLGER